MPVVHTNTSRPVDSIMSYASFNSENIICVDKKKKKNIQNNKLPGNEINVSVFFYKTVTCSDVVCMLCEAGFLTDSLYTSLPKKY